MSKRLRSRLLLVGALAVAVWVALFDSHSLLRRATYAHELDRLTDENTALAADNEALALFVRMDYDNATVPMLTVTHGRKATRTHILVYTILLAAFAIGLGFTQVGGPVYLATALVLNALFVKGAFDIWRRDEAASEADNFKTEKSFFKLSLLYLFAHFGAILVEAGVTKLGLF